MPGRSFRNLSAGAEMWMAQTTLASMLSTEIDRALHLKRLRFLSGGRDWGTEVSQRNRGAFPAFMAAGQAVGRFFRSFGCGPDIKGRNIQRLGSENVNGFADGGFSLLVPFDGIRQISSTGLIALGEKKSELPFSAEDRMLLMAIASAAALTIENRVLFIRTQCRIEGIHPIRRSAGCKGIVVFQRPVHGCGGMRSLS